MTEESTPRTAARIEEGLLEAHRLLPPPRGHLALRRWALRDPTNLLIFTVSLAAGVGRGQWLLAAAALVGEAAWLLLAPWIPGVRRLLEERDRREREWREAERRATVLGGLSAADRARLVGLLEVRANLAHRASAASAPEGDRLLGALAKVDVLLGLCALEARRAAELTEYLRDLDPEQVERDRRRLERGAGSTDAGADALELLQQRQARARAAQHGLEASRTRVAELEAALRAAASVRADGPPEAPLADLLAGVDAVAAATHPETTAGSWNTLMKRTP